VDPLGKQGGLAIARRGREEDQTDLRAQPLVQAGQQAGTGDTVRPQRRDLELGLEEGDVHRALDLDVSRERERRTDPIIGSKEQTSKVDLLCSTGVRCRLTAVSRDHTTAVNFDSDTKLHTMVNSAKLTQGIIPEREERC
jgi:hypothetical protein